MMNEDTNEPTNAAPSGPLVGVHIVDFCSFIAGSFGAMLLGDMGAEVIKVEARGGDASRGWGPFLKGESRGFQGWNRNKRSLAIDLKQPDGLEVAHELVRRADVVMENMRPGVTERLGIDYPSLREINAKIIYLSSTAFGSTGPYRTRPGYDPVLQSLGGAADLNRRFSGVAAICSVAVSDFQAAMLGVSGVCAALYHRERTGEGQLVETSLLQAVMSVQSQQFIKPIHCEEEGAPGIFPYQMFETADDPIFVAAGTDRFWQLFCEVLGLDDLAGNEDFITNSQRTARREELFERVQSVLASRPCREWEESLVDKGVPAAAVQSCLDFLDDPQVEALDMNPVIKHAAIGAMRVAGVPLKFSATPGAIQRAAPRLGEHSREVLGEIGLSRQRIDELIEQEIVVVAGETR